MRVLALDLSLSRSGFAISYKNVIKRRGCYPSNKESKRKERLAYNRMSNLKKTVSIVGFIDDLVRKYEVDDVVIEDTYSGVNAKTAKLLARLGGVVQYYWYKKTEKEVPFMQVVKARKLIGVNPRSTKAEIQLYIAEMLELIKPKDKRVYLAKIMDLKEAYKEGNMIKSKVDYQLTKVSKEIEKEIGLSTDEADAIVLAKAYQRRQNG